MKLSLVLATAKLAPKSFLKLSAESAAVRGLHPLLDVVHHQPALLELPSRGRRLAYCEQPAVQHEVVLDGLALGACQALVALFALPPALPHDVATRK